MGKPNFRGYSISRFYPTREIRENLMQREKYVLQYLMFYRPQTVYFFWPLLACQLRVQKIGAGPPLPLSQRNSK